VVRLRGRRSRGNQWRLASIWSCSTAMPHRQPRRKSRSCWRRACGALRVSGHLEDPPGASISEAFRRRSACRDSVCRLRCSSPPKACDARRRGGVGESTPRLLPALGSRSQEANRRDEPCIASTLDA
jgi:hypothetical protein